MTTLEQQHASIAAEIQKFRDTLVGKRAIGVAELPLLLSYFQRVRELHKDTLKDAPPLQLEGLQFAVEVAVQNEVWPPIVLRNCQFQNKLSFSHTTFSGNLVLDGSNFQATEFLECSFKGDYRADNVSFYGPIDFSGSIWGGNAYIRSTTFYQEASFCRCDFE